MKNLCLQINDNDCGFACLKMILAHVHRKKDYIYLNQEYNRKDNYSFKDLQNIAVQYGLFLEGYRYNNLSQIKKIPVINLINVNNSFHYVIIIKITRKFIYILDPKVGKRKMNVEMFNSVNAYFCLQIEQNNENVNLFTRRKEKNIYPIGLLFIQFLQIVSLFLLSFEVDELSITMLIPLLLFLFSYILLIVFKEIMMKNYDKRIIYPLLKKCGFFDQKVIKKGVENEYKLKKEKFLYYTNIVNNGSICGLVIFILVLNELFIIPLLAIIMIISSLKEKVSFEILSPKIEEINLIENSNNIHDSFVKADILSYKYAKVNNLIEVIPYVIIFLYLFIFCAFECNYSPFIYYLFLSIAFYNEWKKLNLALKQKHKLEKFENIHFSFANFLDNDEKKYDFKF